MGHNGNEIKSRIKSLSNAKSLIGSPTPKVKRLVELSSRRACARYASSRASVAAAAAAANAARCANLWREVR